MRRRESAAAPAVARTNPAAVAAGEPWRGAHTSGGAGRGVVPDTGARGSVGPGALAPSIAGAACDA
ncbi:MAG TPA: hypothetical protein VKE73_00655, partial [Myxococcota bacterium]|nr:hypothetical protein [Myxococcota bacterium]